MQNSHVKLKTKRKHAVPFVVVNTLEDHKENGTKRGNNHD